MATKKNGDTENQWREILERQADCGMSISGFCAAEGIAKSSFYAWRKRLGTGNSNGRRARRKGSVPGETVDNAPLFIPLKLLGAASILEIVHPLGYRIHVTGDVNPVALRHVIETLDERAAR